MYQRAVFVSSHLILSVHQLLDLWCLRFLFIDVSPLPIPFIAVRSLVSSSIKLTMLGLHLMLDEFHLKLLELVFYFKLAVPCLVVF